MLIIRRTVGQAIVIGPSKVPVRILVTETHPKATRLGIEAPQDVWIYREELLDADGLPRRPENNDESGT